MKYKHNPSGLQQIWLIYQAIFFNNQDNIFVMSYRFLVFNFKFQIFPCFLDYNVSGKSPMCWGGGGLEGGSKLRREPEQRKLCCSPQTVFMFSLNFYVLNTCS